MLSLLVQGNSFLFPLNWIKVAEASLWSHIDSILYRSESASTPKKMKNYSPAWSQLAMLMVYHYYWHRRSWKEKGNTKVSGVKLFKQMLVLAVLPTALQDWAVCVCVTSVNGGTWIKTRWQDTTWVQSKAIFKFIHALLEIKRPIRVRYSFD